MTGVGPMLDSRVMAQLRSFPPGQLRTTAEITAALATTEQPRSVEAVLQQFHARGLVRREREPGSRAPYQWGLV